MPRGTIKTDEEKILEIESEIAELELRRDKFQIKIDEKLKEKQDIIDIKKQAELSELLEVVKASGKTTSEILEILQAPVMGTIIIDANDDVPQTVNE